MILNTNLQGKTALVCGASGGIGEACAKTLAEQGARVVLLARREQELERVLKTLPGQGHSYQVCDLSKTEQIESALQAILKNGSVEIVINNSSGPKGGPIAQASAEQFVATFEQHLVASHLIAQKVLPGMREKKYGRIVNVISTSVKVPIPNLGVSNTIRWAVASWAKTLSLEVAADGITVNSVLPGYTETDRLRSLLTANAATQGKAESEIANDWKNSTPMRRFGKPEEIAATVGFLASPAAAFITGTAIAVDGGRTGTL